MSPDEQILAAIVVHYPKGLPATAELQLWDFRAGILLRSRSLPPPEPRPDYLRGAVCIRYTGDGQLLTLFTGGDFLHVLRSSDLEELRQIRISAHPPFKAIEVSPVAHRVAIRGAADVHVYDLDSGDELWQWSTSQQSVFKFKELLHSESQIDGSSLAWRPDGNTLAISVADNAPCLRGGGTVYVFAPGKKRDLSSFRVPLLPASLAFGGGDVLFVSSNTCGGFFTHWTLDLPAYDSSSGLQVDKISAGEVGVRGYITISANQRILLAHADREKSTLAGLEDTLVTEDEQWQVWDITSRKVLLALPPIGRGSVESYPSLSSSGRFVFLYQAPLLQVFAMPQLEKASSH